MLSKHRDYHRRERAETSRTALARYLDHVRCAHVRCRGRTDDLRRLTEQEQRQQPSERRSLVPRSVINTFALQPATLFLCLPRYR